MLGASLFSTVGTGEFWLEASVFAAVFSFCAPIIWKVMGHSSDIAIFSLSLRTRTDAFSFTAGEGVPAEISALKYIHVRYGNDQYLSTLASDSERFHGRTRNRICKISTVRHGSSINILFDIKVHKRLGTQFKLFAECEGDGQVVVDFLKRQKGVREPDAVAHPTGTRVYFLLDRFATVETVDKLENNMIYPE